MDSERPGRAVGPASEGSEPAAFAASAPTSERAAAEQRVSERPAYSERPSTIPGGVLWWATGGPSTRVLPDGCMDLIWMGGDVVVAGPDTGVYEHAGTTGDGYVGLRFAPGALPELLEVPAADLTDGRIPLRDLIEDRTVRSLVDRLGGNDSPGRVLESFPEAYAAARARRRALLLRGGGRPWSGHGPRPPAGRAAPLVGRIARLLEMGTPVTAVADQVNLSARQLHRLSRERFGYGPKTLASILRFQRALRLATVEGSSAMLARRAGYADQAHLSRETRRLAGTTFGSLVRS